MHRQQHTTKKLQRPPDSLPTVSQDFILLDPIQWPHRFSQPDSAECVAFISAMFAYGQRPLILQLLAQLIEPLGEDPVRFLLAQSDHDLQERFPGFRYRFNTHEDYWFLLSRLRWVYAEFGSLEKLLLSVEPASDYRMRLAAWMDALLGPTVPERNGIRYLFAHPARGGSCKRLHLFLRWMVRGPDGIDLGLWKRALTPAQLLVPLDTHVAKAARALGYTSRKANDWKTVEAITQALRQQCLEDPISMDVALFEYGRSIGERPAQ